ncbi:MAG: hypothetical protein L7F77_16320 [Candidatus Magnetominusculus sp. LBB02]|nr:hypothetical protein [Candidatus Magnetominusculus sp. LBB02]
MVIYEKPGQIDKRKGPDVIVKTLRWTIVACWVLIFVAWSYVYYAMPEPPSVFVNPNIAYRQTRTYWDLHLIKKAFIAINALLMFSVAGLAESFFRHRRAEDRTPKTLILMVIMSVIGLFFLYYYF